MKQTMYYCGIALIVLSFLALVMTADPLAVGRYFGGIGAGIVLTIIGDISLYRQYHNTHMEYEIIIDDSASFNEVTSVYDILSRENDIYRVKLLEDTNIHDK